MISATAEKLLAPLVRVERADANALPHPVALIGSHQKINAALALATVETLQEKLPISRDSIRSGLATVHWAGRLQLIERANGATILLDGAHNPAGAGVLRSALENEFAGRRPLLIFGSLSDKRWPEVCGILAPLADRIVTVPVASIRTAGPAEVASAFRAAHPAAEISPCASLREAISINKDAGFIVITGSLYLVGEALDLLATTGAGESERRLNEWSGSPKSG